LRESSPNANVLNALVLWGILSPKQLSILIGVSVSYCSKELQKLVILGLAEDVGRTKLDPSDPLYGRYYLIRRSSKLLRWTKAKCRFRLRNVRRLTREKLVVFTGGKAIQRHYLFSTLAAFWVADHLSRIDEQEVAICFPETYLRSNLGWHRGAAPVGSVSNPRLTMVPDALVLYRRVEIRIEAEITPKSRAAYHSVFNQLRVKDDTVIYVYPDEETKRAVERFLPQNYRVGGVVFGDNSGLKDVVRRLVLSLFDRRFDQQPTL
jgi:hypothetical protein